MLDAGVEYLLTRANLNDAQRAAVWLTGSLNGRGWEYVRPLSIALAVLVPVALVCTRNLRVLELGDDTARGRWRRPPPLEAGPDPQRRRPGRGRHRGCRTRGFVALWPRRSPAGSSAPGPSASSRPGSWARP